MEENNKYIPHENIYMVIPTTIGLDLSLPPAARILYGLISSLTYKEGYCWATNAYFAETLGCSKRTITGWLSLLAEKKYIRVEVVYKENTNEVLGRKIWLENSRANTNSNIENDVVNFPQGVSKKFSIGSEKNFHINNINNNNINNNINTLCEQVHREQENSTGKQSKTKKEKYTEQDKELALYLKAKLEERGATVFPRDWLMKNYATAHRLLKTVSLDELKSCIDWLLEDEYWRSRVDSLLVIERKIAQFQLQNKGQFDKSPYDDLF